MKENRITRRAMLRLGAVAAGSAALGYAGLSSIGKLGATEGAFASAIPGRLPMEKLKGFTGKPPNIILILCDDMGQGDPGCYGNTVVRTPNIDRLSREGVRFTDFYASASLCTPSRAGLLTGRYAVRTGLIFPLQSGGQPMMAKILQSVARGIGRLGAFDFRVKSFVDGLPADEITVADGLRMAGYRTMAIGKWHLGDFSKDPQYHPMRHGFDEFFGTPMSNDELPNPLYRNDTMLEADIGLNQERLTGLITKEAVGFIERSRGKAPFFLYMAHYSPHLPFYPSDKFKGVSKGGAYGDVVEELDHSVGEIMKCLARNGLDNDTMVIFTSDNGPWFEGRPGDGFRGRKGQSYEGGFRAPLIVRHPARVRAGSVCTAPATNIDFFPTLLAAAGVTLPSDRVIDGKDIGGLITGKEKKSPHEALYFYHDEKLEGVRAGEWKYFRSINHYNWPIPLDKPETPLGMAAKDRFLGRWPNLYNVERDEGENYDLATRYPKVCEKMEKLMADRDASIKRDPRGGLAPHW
ncbi:MAG: sulfatase [Spirochaetes bacterium]|nr:sulfatase [Spirochaetota bacterium]